MNKSVTCISHRFGLVNVGIIGMVFVIIGLGGCATPPDVKQFSKTSSTLSLVVPAVGNEVSNELRRFAKNDPSRAAEWTRLKTDFEEDWAVREATMKAVAAYSNGLVAVVESGNNGESNASEVLNGANTLVSTVGIVFPVGSTVYTAVSNLAIKGYGVAARDRAARSVHVAIQDASPEIRAVADALAADFTELESAFNDLYVGEQTIIKAKHLENWMAFNTIKSDRDNAMDNARISIRYKVKLTPEEFKELTPEEKLEYLDNVNHDDALYMDAKRWNEMYASELNAPWYAEMNAELDSAQTKFDERIQFLQAASATLRAWGTSHKDLALAAEVGVTPDYTALIQLTQDLLVSYEEIRRND